MLRRRRKGKQRKPTNQSKGIQTKHQKRKEKQTEKTKKWCFVFLVCRIGFGLFKRVQAHELLEDKHLNLGILRATSYMAMGQRKSRRDDPSVASPASSSGGPSGCGLASHQQVSWGLNVQTFQKPKRRKFTTVPFDSRVWW